MVVIDVVMIGTEETMGTSAGVNLLNGLKIQFGDSGRPAYSKEYSETGTTTLARAISIPAISYTMNIANTNSGRAEILTRPTLVATVGRPSDFFSGTELNAAAVSASSGGIATQPINIQKEIGVKLMVLPNLMPDGRLNLQVSAQRTFIKAPNANVDFQMRLETTKVSVNANVVMKFGESLILGGLNEKELDQTRDGVPLFQDIPGVQYLFSNKKRNVYQNSLLVLITPRPPQYIYQTEAAREEYEKSLSEEERQVANLRARYADWFKPYPNWASVFNRLQDNALYREFRTGDVTLESWSGGTSLLERLKEIRNFLHY